ncbi:PREDICTED: uncharacterized protein LOC105958200 [Erythranthe guttata]|uniref:uncharacterized protein LOC105958200 n=1 Tax=Erythranthe guttata TaxID=4155 RepID=UPI00064E13C6|nr:PREDICTED: uncharacterized protein LOC105958200 [Erythranthe guttata]|eukprot:XP_012837661.1 PREDICTED: uncharacterized protein LOC105958200 [Erythranthe guttata]
MTENMQGLVGRNAVLENSLSTAEIELEGLGEKSKGLEEICELFKNERSFLLTERGSLVSKLENVERRLQILEKKIMGLEEKYTDLEKEKEAMHDQVEKLKVSLDEENQERTSSHILSETRLARLENQINLLKEQNTCKKKETEQELDKALKAQFEISILHKFIKAQSGQPRHFSALSLLFLLPISISSGVYPFLLPPPSYNNINNNSKSVPSQFIIQLIYLLFAVIFGLCGGASITHTAIHGFYGEPVEITSALKSIPVSFLPLFVTKLVYLIILWLIFICYGILIAFAYGGLLLFRVQLDYGGPNFVALVVVMTCLSTAVVVVESRWGYAPLKRSWYLVRGMGWVVFGTIMLLAVPS